LHANYFKGSKKRVELTGQVGLARGAMDIETGYYAAKNSSGATIFFIRNLFNIKRL